MLPEFEGSFQGDRYEMEMKNLRGSGSIATVRENSEGIHIPDQGLIQDSMALFLKSNK